MQGTIREETVQPWRKGILRRAPRAGKLCAYQHCGARDKPPSYLLAPCQPCNACKQWHTLSSSSPAAHPHIPWLIPHFIVGLAACRPPRWGRCHEHGARMAAPASRIGPWPRLSGGGGAGPGLCPARGGGLDGRARRCGAGPLDRTPRRGHAPHMRHALPAAIAAHSFAPAASASDLAAPRAVGTAFVHADGDIDFRKTASAAQ